MRPSAAPPWSTFDARPLTEPVRRADVRRSERELKSRFGRTGPHSAGAVTALTVFCLFFALGGVGWGLLIAASGPNPVRDPSTWPSFAWPAIFVAFPVVVAVFIIQKGLGGKRRRYVLARFAQANGMSYLPWLDSPPLPGMLFHQGDRRGSTDVLRREQPRFVEFANFSYTESGSSDSNSSTYRWGYVAIHLDAPLPHIVLDALGNNGGLGRSNLPMAFRGSQRLSLEGDFDRYFALYCPRGYERDALYLFTPDVMARLIDYAARLDVEIIDDWMFLYTREAVVTTDPAAWAQLFSVVAALTQKLTQWGRWRDERLAAGAAAPESSVPAGATAGTAFAAGPITGASGGPSPADPPTATDAPPQGPVRLSPPPGVAPQGRRLTRRLISWRGALILLGVVLYWAIVHGPLRGLLFGH